MVIRLVILLLFFTVTIGIGFYYIKKVGNVSGFVLGDRNIGAWITAFAYGTTYFSAVVFIGYAGQFGSTFGISSIWIGIGNAFLGSLLAWVVLGRRTRIMTKHFESATMPDFFGARYSSKALKITASVIIFVFLIPYSASVYKGLSGLFSMAYGIDFTYCVIAMAVITAIYVILGGYKAIALNDFVQGIIMLVGIISVIGVVLNANGGFTQSLIGLSKFNSPIRPELQGAYVSIFGPDPIGLLGVVILTSLGAWGLPQMIHKFYTIKSEKAIKIGAIISTVFALVIAGGSYFIGTFGRLFVDTTKFKFDDIVPNMLGSALQGTVGDILMGVVVILVLSASMSTLSSLVISSSSTVTIDFIKQIFAKNMKDKTQVMVIKILCGFFILLSVAIAIYTSQPGVVTPITTLMSISWGAIAGAFLPAFLYGLFWKGVTKAGVWAGFAVGIGITVANAIPGLTFTTPPSAGAVAMIVTLIVVPVVSLVTPKLSKKHIDESFSCYDKKSDEIAGS